MWSRNLKTKSENVKHVRLNKVRLVYVCYGLVVSKLITINVQGSRSSRKCDPSACGNYNVHNDLKHLDSRPLAARGGTTAYHATVPVSYTHLDVYKRQIYI